MKTYENPSFRIEAEEKPGCIWAVSITVTPEETKKAYKKATKKINKEISIPGFRKGKAPDATVVSRYGAYVEQEWKEILVNEAYHAALDLTKVYPLTKDSIQKPKVEKCSLEEGAIVSLAYEHYPEVPTIDFGALTLPSFEKPLVTEDRVNEVLLEIQRSNAEWEDVEGRTVQEGDFVDVTIHSLDDDPPKEIVKDRRFEVDEKRMAPWLKNLLIGLEKGQTREGLSEVDENATEEIKEKFKPTNVRVTLHALKKMLPAALDDELAKKVGVESLEKLKEKVQQNIEDRDTQDLREKQIAELEKILLETYHFEVPASIAKSESEKYYENRLTELRNQNMSEAEIQNQESALRQEASREAESSVRLYFIEKQIADQGDISLRNEEINREIMQQVSKNLMLYGREMDREASKNFISRLSSALLQQKTREYALDQVLGKQNS